MAVQKKNVAIIPPQVKYDKQLRVEQKILRVAAYCRVSTLLEQQEGSYEAQVDYYTNKINSNSTGNVQASSLTMESRQHRQTSVMILTP